MKAIIFDCDGVLVDSEVLYQRIERGALEEIGLFYETEAYVTRFMGTGEKNWFREVEKDYREKFASPLPDNFKDNLNQKLKAEFAELLEIIPGIPSLLENLNEQTMAVASSSHLAFLHTKLEQTGIKQFFGTHIYSGQEVANAKPAPDLFLHTAESIGFTPENCIVVEDSENGVKAGLAAGMHVIGFCGGGHSGTAYGEKLKALGAHDIAMNAEELEMRLKAA